MKDVTVKPGKEFSSECENNFQQTTTRDEEGRYVVYLPFKEPNNINLGHSRSIAQAQFLRNEVRFSKNAPLKKQYDSVIQEYLDLGHMPLVSPNDDSRNFYLPHHALLKPDSIITKVRIVFKTSNKS